MIENFVGMFNYVIEEGLVSLSFLVSPCCEQTKVHESIFEFQSSSRAGLTHVAPEIEGDEKRKIIPTNGFLEHRYM